MLKIRSIWKATELKGFTRTNRQECDFYVPNDRPKTLWVKAIARFAERLDDPAQLGMFGMRTLVQTRRQWEHLSGPHKGERTKVETSYHASTIEIDERHGVDFAANLPKLHIDVGVSLCGRRSFRRCTPRQFLRVHLGGSQVYT